MKNPFPFSDDNKRYHTFDYEMKHLFGGKVVKVAIDAGFTCPNRDGSKGYGGCRFCSDSGSGEFAGTGKTLAEQFKSGKKQLAEKWASERFLVYFQSHTGTYTSADHLRSLFDEGLRQPGTVGLSVATRPDCLPPDILDLLLEYSKKTFLTVELGLQTVHDRTALRLNRCHDYADFSKGYESLAKRGIRTCVHLIDSLPGETREMMLESALQVASLSPWGIKLHMLHVLKDTPLGQDYLNHPFDLLSLEEYADLICDQIECFPPETVIERVTGDPPADQLIAPVWTRKKRSVLAAIDREFAKRGTFQGIRRAPVIPDGLSG